MKSVILMMLSFTLLWSGPVRAEEVWKVGQVLIPGYVESAREGAWIRYLKILAYEIGVRFDIKILSHKRNVVSLHKGETDMIIGFLVPENKKALDRFNVRLSHFDVAELDFYMYSNREINLAKLSELNVGATLGIARLFKRNLVGHKCVSCALRMVLKGRLDGFLSTEAVTEIIIKQEGIEGLHRTFFASLPIKVLFRNGVSKEAEERLLEGFIRTVKSGVYEEALGIAASKNIVQRYRKD